MYENDKRVVMTLDAGGTNFVFSAMQGGKEIVDPVLLPSVPDNLEGCLSQLLKGFEAVKEKLAEQPVAISFAFPGPADYCRGIIGDLPNFPAFRGGVALGPFLEEKFNLPVYINNDGNLYAYGEALFGFLPQINRMLAESGSSRKYKNLIGITLGTGFGCGVVLDNVLLTGDNSCGGDMWLMRNIRNLDMISEENVSIRGIKRVYHELSGLDASALTPKDIFDIAEGKMEGDSKAAAASFYQLGEVVGNAIVHGLDIVDGMVVLGGGVSKAAKYIMPGILEAVNGQVKTYAGDTFPCLQISVYDLTDEEGMKIFLKDEATMVKIPGTDKEIAYPSHRKAGVAVTSVGASNAIALGAYAFALNKLDNR